MVVNMKSGLVEYDILQLRKFSLLLPFHFTFSTLKTEAAGSSKHYWTIWHHIPGYHSLGVFVLSGSDCQTKFIM
jgi:hypothetical protein